MSDTVHPVGFDYCTNHAGISDVDQDRCDFAPACHGCAGSGDSYDEDGNIVDDCPECAGEGIDPCQLYPLFYVEQAS